MSTDTKALTVVERIKLDNLEEVIRDGLDQVFAVGNALRQIRDGRLYRLTHDTFESYCEEKWQLARRTAYQHIAAAEVSENVRQGAQINPPENERQARPLSRLPAAEQPAAWQEAVETAPAGKVTAKHVEEVVQRRMEPEHKERESVKEKPAPPTVEPEAEKDRCWELVSELYRITKSATLVAPYSDIRRLAQSLRDAYREDHRQ